MENKVAIVTGGASGIGRALCEELGCRGAAAIIVADINAEGAQEVAATNRRAQAMHAAFQVIHTQSSGACQTMAVTKRLIENTHSAGWYTVTRLSVMLST